MSEVEAIGGSGSDWGSGLTYFFILNFYIWLRRYDIIWLIRMAVGVNSFIYKWREKDWYTLLSTTVVAQTPTATTPNLA